MTVKAILSQKWVVPTAVVVASAAAGFGAAYLYDRHKRDEGVDITDEVFAAIQEKEEDPQMSMLDDNGDPKFSMVGGEKPFPDPELVELVEGFGYKPVVVDAGFQGVTVNNKANVDYSNPDSVEGVRENIFDGVDSEWDYEFELSQRDPNGPYIIHYDEFIANEREFQQETLQYYMGDDVLADQRDEKIEDYLGLTGELKFGHGSNDANVVYIRNEGIRMEWEILFSHDEFQTVVLGENITTEYEETDLKHSMNRKFRDD